MSQVNNIPRLRFDSFNGLYNEVRLSSLLQRYSQKNSDEEFKIGDILSLSSTHGIVDRKELLDNTYENVNHLAYVKTRVNDFIYGKSITKENPYGLFRANLLRDGLLSTLYFTFKVSDAVIPKFLEYYFGHINRANNYLKKFVLVGDRYITADANYILSGKVLIPNIPEQQKIADFLTAVDKRIELLEKKKTLLETYKKGVMKKIFNQEIRFKDDNGNDFPDWDSCKLGQIGKFKSGVGFPSSEQGGNEGIPFFKVSDMNLFGNEINMTISNNKVTIEQISYLGLKPIVTDSIIFAKVGAAIFLERKRIAKDFLIDNNMMAFTPIKGNINFFKHLFDSVRLSKYSQVGALPSYNSSDLATIKVGLPSIEEQVKISKFLTSIDDQIRHLGSQIDKSKTWKKGLLQKMFV